MLSEIQKEIIKKRILATVKLFFENNGLISDEDLARILSIEGYRTSSSTVGRDLTSNTTKELIGTEEYKTILKLRLENKNEGNKKGGQISSSVNNIIKDEYGHFIGCEKRKM